MPIWPPVALRLLARKVPRVTNQPPQMKNCRNIIRLSRTLSVLMVLSLLLCTPVVKKRLIEPQQPAVTRCTAFNASEIIEGPRGAVDQLLPNEMGTFGRSLPCILEAAFPFEHCPAVIAVLRQLAEYLLEIYLTVSQQSKPSVSLHPVLVSAVSTAPHHSTVLRTPDVK